MKHLQAETGMALMLITHDLGVVAETCHRVAVMYTGKIVETAPVDSLFARPAHPYTRGLFESLPKQGIEKTLIAIPGTVPSLMNLPRGCAFQDRCRFSDDKCVEEPPWLEVHSGHMARCWRPLGEIS
jgi:oligopeptide/dipeptide ABC transporter ATP-binding protein